MPRQRNPLLVPKSLQCFTCGHEYDHLGDGAHPGVCTECGQRAVSFAGDVEISAVNSGEAFGKADMLEVYLEDATDRVFTYYLSLDEDAEVACLYVVRMEDTRLTPQNQYWSRVFVPEVLRELIEDRDGFDMTLDVPNTGSDSDSGSNSDRGMLR